MIHCRCFSGTTAQPVTSCHPSPTVAHTRNAITTQHHGAYYVESRSADFHAAPCFAEIAFYDCGEGREGGGGAAGASLHNAEEAELACLLFKGGNVQSVRVHGQQS